MNNATRQNDPLFSTIGQFVSLCNRAQAVCLALSFERGIDSKAKECLEKANESIQRAMRCQQEFMAQPPRPSVYTEEMLVSRSLKKLLTDRTHPSKSMRHPDTVYSTVLSPNRVDELLNSGNEDLLIFSSVALFNDEKVSFLSDDSMFGSGVFPSCFGPCTVTLPSRAAPREVIPDGVIRTAEQLLGVYAPKTRILQNIQELLEYLNANYTKY